MERYPLFIGGPPIQVVVLRAPVVPPRLLSPKDAERPPESCNCTPADYVRLDERRMEGREGSRSV
jgi:hypothetical protein